MLARWGNTSKVSLHSKLQFSSSAILCLQYNAECHAKCRRGMFVHKRSVECFFFLSHSPSFSLNKAIKRHKASVQPALETEPGRSHITHQQPGRWNIYNAVKKEDFPSFCIFIQQTTSDLPQELIFFILLNVRNWYCLCSSYASLVCLKRIGSVSRSPTLCPAEEGVNILLALLGSVPLPVS